MGQPVGVVEKPSSKPGIVRFELNRTLTGMGHERYTVASVPPGRTPGEALARRLFDTGKVVAVAIYGNMVTVDLGKGRSSEGLRPLVESLYTYYVPGFVPPPIEMPAEPAAAAAASGGDAAAAAAAAAAGIDSRVPAHLIERSRLAREKWAATH